MSAGIEFTAGVLRAGPQFKVHGDPYTFACSVLIRGNRAELIGAAGVMTPSVWKACREQLLHLGIDEVTYDRVHSLRRSVKHNAY